MKCKSCGVDLGLGLLLDEGWEHGAEGPLCGKCIGDKPDWHVFPVNDLRPHQLTRRCWCEPTLEWPCAACAGEGTITGSGEPEDEAPCPVCRGTGSQTKANPEAGALVVHEPLDGRT